jgi:hypothetical protein
MLQCRRGIRSIPRVLLVSPSTRKGLGLITVLRERELVQKLVGERKERKRSTYKRGKGKEKC